MVPRSPIDTDSETPKLSFLGPHGTYSHQAAYDRFGTRVRYSSQERISDVFNTVSPSIPFALIPQENSTFGSVIETYDLLRSQTAGEEVFIRGEVTFRVQHCLLVRKGTMLEDIQKVYSHEQALGQCSNFIAKFLPRASLVKMSSTASAAQAISSPDPIEGSSHHAAICSRLCATVFEGLEVLREGIQDQDVNYTRFYVLTYGENTQIPPSSQRGENSDHRWAVIRISTDSTKAGSTALHVGNLISSLALCVTRIDRRPSLSSIPFHDIYFIEVQGGHEAETSWMKRVDCSIQQVRASGASAHVLGIW